VQISKPEESVEKIMREAAVPQLPAQLLQFQLEGREGDRPITVSITGQQRLAYQCRISLSPFCWNMETNPISVTM
jgi:hypothetical protein